MRREIRKRDLSLAKYIFSYSSRSKSYPRKVWDRILCRNTSNTQNFEYISVEDKFLLLYTEYCNEIIFYYLNNKLHSLHFFRVSYSEIIKIFMEII